MFLLICKLYICIQNVFGHIFYSTRLHLYQQVWQFEVQKLAYMLILAAGGMIPYLSSVGGHNGRKSLILAPQEIPDISGYQWGFGCQFVKAYITENPVTNQKIL